MSETDISAPAEREPKQPLRNYAAGLLLGVAGITTPMAGALAAIEYAPANHLEIAGQDVAVKPVIGQNTSRLDEAIIRPEHAHVLGKDIGVNVSVDLNKITPNNKGTRTYLNQLWSDPDPEIARIQDTARDYVVEWSLKGGGSVLLTEAGIGAWVLLRRRSLTKHPEATAQQIRNFNRPARYAGILAGAVAIAGLDYAGAAVYLHHDEHHIIASPTLAGTPLEGTEVTGLAGDALPFVSAMEPKNGFDDAAAKHLESAIAAHPELQAGDHEITFVAAEDFEDVNGMARQTGLAAKLVHAKFIAYTGDLTFAGNPLESYLLDTMNYYSDGIKVHFAPGPHDTPYIVDTAKDRGWEIADDSTHDVSGVPMLFMADPRVSTVGNFGPGDILRDPSVTTEQALAKVITETCDTHPALVFVHDHKYGQQIAETGCQTAAVIDGRSYYFVGPRSRTTETGAASIEYTNGSGGGHTSTNPDPGQIKHPATISVFKYNTETGDLYYSVVTTNPTGSVTVTPYISANVSYTEFLDSGRTLTDSEVAAKQAGTKTTPPQSRPQAHGRRHITQPIVRG